MIKVITFALVLISFAFSQETNDDAKRVIGGVSAPSGWFPYQVALAYQGNPSYPAAQFCGGSIVNQQWIVTAAHCLGSTPVDSVITYWRVIVGVTDLTQVTAANVYYISAVYQHPNYNSNNQDNDVLMLKLSRPITYTATAKSINFANAALAEVNSYSNITGWGKVASSQSNRGQVGSGSDTLQYATVPLVSRTSCSTTYTSMGITVTSNQICAGMVGKDTCQGDSGGPMAAVYQGTPTLIGITSWGVGCAEYPGVYTKVANYVPYISNCISQGYCSL